MRINKLIILYLSIALLMMACQTPNEPEIVIKDVTFTVRVEDQSGNPIPSVKVQYANLPNATSTDLIPFSNGITDERGMLSEKFAVSNHGRYITVKITPPSNDPNFVEQIPIIYNSLKVHCSDTVIKLIIPRRVVTPCNTNIGTTEVKPISICYKYQTQEAVFTPFFAPNCSEEMTVEVSGFTQIQNAHLQIIKESQPGINQTSPFKLTPGDKFEVGMLFTPTNEQALRNEEVVVKITPKDASQYTYTNILFSAESKCQDCACPETFDIVYPSATGYASFCLGEAKDFDVSLSNVFNSSTECKMVLSLEKSFNNSNIKIVSINGSTNIQDIILAPGSSMQKMRLNALLTNDGNIEDELLFNIAMIDLNGNKIECPNAKLRVKVRLGTNSLACQYDMQSPIFEQPGYSTQSTVTLLQGVGVISNPLGKTEVKIQNMNPNCPLILTGLDIAGDNPFYFLDNSGKSIGKHLSAITIPNNSYITIYVGFQPSEADYDRNSPTGPVTKFNGSLTIYSNSSKCKLDVLPLKGEIVFSKPNDISITEYGTNGNYSGAYFEPDGSSVTSKPSTTKNFALYFENINLSANKPSAVMKASGNPEKPGTYYIKFRKIASNVNYEAGEKDIQDLAKRPAFANAIASSNPEFVTSTTINVNDLIHIKYSYIIDGKEYEYNALIRIYAIDESLGTNPHTPKVGFTYCTGV